MFVIITQQENQNPSMYWINLPQCSKLHKSNDKNNAIYWISLVKPSKCDKKSI